MKLVRYAHGDTTGVGILEGQSVVPLSGTKTMLDIVEGGIEQLLAPDSDAGRLALDDVKLLSPLERPGKFICMGLNYAEHVKEGGRELPEFPTLFLRVQTSLLPPDGDIVLPKASAKLDYEAELLVVIGKKVSNVSEDDALDAVFGYTAFNDGSLRDFQRQTTQWTAGKNFDATGPFGPAIVTADELPLGAEGLTIRSRLNGQVMQDGNTQDMIFPVAKIISYASQVMTLEPGDVIATGTPSGVGFARTPPVFMKEGDLIQIEIEGIPTLSNRVVAAA